MMVMGTLAFTGTSASASIGSQTLDGSMIEGVRADNSDDGSILVSFSAIVDSNPDSAPEHVWTIDGRPFDGHFIDFHDSTARFFHAFSESEGIFRPIPGVIWVFTDIDDSMDDFAAVTSGSHFGEEVDWTRLDMGVLNEDRSYVDFAGIVQIPIRHGDSFDLDITFALAPANVALFMGAGLSRRRCRY